LAAAGTAGAVAVGVVKPAAAKSAKSAATRALLLGLDFHCGAEKQGQNTAEKFFETVCFHSLPFN